jgi:dCMP deaminase
LLGAFNQHVPSEQSAYLYGDPRSNFEAGQCIDMSGALHAEAGLIAEAARRGISTEGCDLFVTVFPCPPCAFLWAYSGIKHLYYVDGYSLIAGAETLQAKDVEIIRVEMNSPSS